MFEGLGFRETPCISLPAENASPTVQLQQAIQASLEDRNRPSLLSSPAVAVHPDALAFSPRDSQAVDIGPTTSDLDAFFRAGRSFHGMFRLSHFRICKLCHRFPSSSLPSSGGSCQSLKVQLSIALCHNFCIKQCQKSEQGILGI